MLGAYRPRFWVLRVRRHALRSEWPFIFADNIIMLYLYCKLLALLLLYRYYKKQLAVFILFSVVSHHSHNSMHTQTLTRRPSLPDYVLHTDITQ